MRLSRTTIGLLLLGSLALGLRVGLVFALQTDHAGPVVYEHGRIAENLLAGRGFSVEFLGTDGPTSQQAPFYPFLLACAYWCFGIASFEAHLAVQLLQCIAGAGLVLAVVWLSWLLVPDRRSVGWIAGLGAAVYPTHVYMVTHLQVALWAALLVTLLLAVASSPYWRRTKRGAVLAGCLAGTLMLVEPILALAVPVCGLVFWLGEGNGRWTQRLGPIRLRRALLLSAVAGLVISPWLLRNWLVHGEFVFIKSTFGYAFWQGNNPASWGTDKIPKSTADVLRRQHDGTLAGMDRALWEARHETLYIDDVLLKPAGYREFAGRSEPQRSRLLGRRAWQYVRSHPAHYRRLCLQRLRYFLLFDETNPKAAHRVYRAATVIWLVLAVIGAIVSLERWRALWPTYAIFALVTIFHTLVIVSVRFRVPVEPLTFVWAASGIAPLVGRLMPGPRIRVYRPGERSSPPVGPKHALKGPHWKHRPRRRVA